MNIIFWGTPEFCIPIFEAIRNSSHNIIAVVTQPDKKRGRGKDLSFSPIKQKAIELNIPTFTPEKIKSDEATWKFLEDLEADLYVVVAFGQILPKKILNLPKYGCWNIHASLLPKWRGAAPIQWAVTNGDKQTGVCIIKMDEGLDTGAVLLEESIDIGCLDNSDIVKEKLSNLSSRKIIIALNKIQKCKNNDESIESIGLINQENIDREKTYARLINKDDYLINWHDTSTKIHQKVLGLYPNCYTFFFNKRIKITQTIPINDKFANYLDENIRSFIGKEDKNIKPGQIIDTNSEVGIVVKTSESLLLVKGAKIEGKSELFGKSLIQQLSTYNKHKEMSFNSHPIN